MKNNSITIGIIALLMISVYFNTRQWQSASDRTARTSDLLTSINNGGFAPIIGVETLKDSSRVTTFKEIYVPHENAVKNAVTSGYADTIANALSLALTEIAELKHINATLQSTVKLTRAVSDTGEIASAPLKYSGKYLHVKFNPLTDSLSYKYSIQLSAVRRKKENVWDVYSPDPNLYINNLKTFTIDATQRSRRLGLGLSAGYGYGVNGWQPYVGLSLNYNLIEF